MVMNFANGTLGQVEIFKHLATEDLRALEAVLETRALKRGDVLVRQGDSADVLYVVVSGRLAVELTGKPGPVAEIGAGATVGEMAFLAGGRRTATVTAVRDSVVTQLGKAEFDRLCGRSPAIWRALSATLATRLAEANQRGVSADATHSVPPRTIAIITAGPKWQPRRFVELLAEAFRADGPVRVVRSDDLAGLIGRATPLESDTATRLLNELERPNETVLFVADRELTAWSEKVIRQADLVLRVGTMEYETTADVALSPHETLAESLIAPAAQRLVLLHGRRRRPRGTRHWLAGRRVAMHHHATLGDRDDIDRLVRFIKGRALGLVACGGGAFCASHIGIWKAVLERGLSFDIMGGTSGGSAMAAAFAMGLAPDEIDRATHEIFVANRALGRYTWPRYSFLDHTHFDRQLTRHYGNVNIEDLWIPFFAVSSNLSRTSLHVHRTGELWRALRASGSIPGLLPPYYTEDGEMLVDGCLLDNVPVATMHSTKQGPNVVVAFEAPRLERFDIDYGQLPSRNALLKHYLNPFRRGAAIPNAPGVGSVLLRSLMANRQDFERHLRDDDLLLVPPLPAGMGVLDWGRHSELLASAYTWARPELERQAAASHRALQPFARPVTAAESVHAGEANAAPAQRPEGVAGAPAAGASIVLAKS